MSFSSVDLNMDKMIICMKIVARDATSPSSNKRCNHPAEVCFLYICDCAFEADWDVSLHPRNAGSVVYPNQFDRMYVCSP
jgi:hypothetical protein